MKPENGDDTIDQQTEDQLLAEDELEGEDLENFNKLTEYGINKAVAGELIKIYKTGKLSHSDLDERALDALKEYNPNDAIQVLKGYCEQNLEHVTNKSAFLCGQMKAYKTKNKAGGAAAQSKGPDQAKLQEILDRTGYSLDVTTGQRKYGGPPPDWDDKPQPGAGHEVFCGKIPKEIFEDELVPLFEKCGKIWDMRLMMDPYSGMNRGYAFVTYCDREAAQEAVKQLDGFEIRKGKPLKLNISVANLRLFVGNIPKNKTRDEIKEEFGKRTEGLIEVIVYGSADNPKLKNRGFAFLEYDTHKNASTAKRKLATGRVKVWQCDIIVDWADPQEEPDRDTMSKVKVLYVRNLTSDVTEDQLKEKFGEYGKVERVKKIKDYGFVHFEERDDAVKAMEALNATKIGNLEIDVSLAKPPTENKKKEQRKRDQDRRMMMRGGGYGGGWDDYYAPPMRPQGGMPRGGGMRRLPPPDLYYEDYYAFEDDYYYPPYGPPAPPMHRGRGRGGPYSPPTAYAGRQGWYAADAWSRPRRNGSARGGR
ncbi:heterogeneous nuclear ribonucleoprotein R-like isoform X2 [Littorina saxatilis]|uniref:heterogeneous nuclear ribonucleoprotein R-like isoform X2 n=1 Tax=Littorina saxatilis TaxID=31220 RepID=UPI0038B4F9F7